MAPQIEEKIAIPGPVAQRVDLHTHVPEEKLVKLPPFPDSIKIEITSRCNYNCSYCASKKNLREQGDMDKKLLFRLLHEAKEAGVSEIGFFLLGEPFLVDELAEYVRYAKEEAGIEYVFITTNGSLCSPERINPVVDAGLDSVKFSINAGTRQRYAVMHGVDAMDTVLRNLKTLSFYKRSRGLDKPYICVSSIFNEKAMDELVALRDAIKPYIDDFYFLPLYNQAGHVGRSKGEGVVGNPGRLENLVPTVPCWALFNAVKITWKGIMTACCFDHDSRFEIADLKETSLIRAWGHPKFVELRKAHLSTDKKALAGSICSRCLGLN